MCLINRCNCKNESIKTRQRQKSVENGPPHLLPQKETKNSLSNNGITLSMDWPLQRCQVIMIVSLALRTAPIVTSPPTSRMEIG